MTKQPSLVCPVCKRETWNPNDIEHGYCGACHDYTSPSQAVREARERQEDK